MKAASAKGVAAPHRQSEAARNEAAAAKESRNRQSGVGEGAQNARQVGGRGGAQECTQLLTDPKLLTDAKLLAGPKLLADPWHIRQKFLPFPGPRSVGLLCRARRNIADCGQKKTELILVCYSKMLNGGGVRNLTLRQIETLQAVAEAGSLIRASTALNMTPAALTARVKGLEDAVGLRLFDRASTGMRLTKAGEAALAASHGVARAMRDFADAIEAIGAGEGGRLSVGAVSTAKYFAPRLIAAFVASRPRLELRFQIGNRDAMIESLRGDEVEIALTGRPPRDMAVEKSALGPHPYVLIAPPEHRLAASARLDARGSGGRGVPVP